MAKIFIEDTTLSAIADAIRSNTGDTEKIATTEMAKQILSITGYDEGYQKGFSDGKDSVLRLEEYAYNLQLWSLNIFGAKTATLNLSSAYSLQNLCSLAISDKEEDRINNTLEELIVNCPNQVTVFNNFLNCSNFNIDNVLKKVTLNVDSAKATSFANAFNNLRALEIIDGTPLDLSSAINIASMFGSCVALKEVRFKGEIKKSLDIKSSPLTKESITSVVPCLSDTTTEFALTLKKAAVDKAFESSEGAADGSTSDQWLALIATKSNWTFSLI